MSPTNNSTPQLFFFLRGSGAPPLSGAKLFGRLVHVSWWEDRVRDLPPSPPPSDRRCPRRRRRRLSSPPSLLLTALVPSRLVALSRLLPPAFPLRRHRQCLRRHTVQPFQRQPYRCRQSSTSFIVGSRLLAAGRLLAASAASSSSISASSLAAAAAHPARCGCVFARPSRTLYSADHCALALPPPVTQMVGHILLPCAQRIVQHFTLSFQIPLPLLSLGGSGGAG